MGVLVLMWIVQTVQWAIPLFSFGSFGVLPRTVTGLKGILLSPLIHGGWGHLISNTIPFAVLSAMVFLFFSKVAKQAFWMIYLLSGLAVWLFARPVFHVGASGVVYGLVAFVFWTGIFRRDLKSIALALVVLFYYGSLFLGLLPFQDGISWESHLLGGLVGIFAAYWFKDQGKKERKPYSWEQEPEEAPRQFLDEDTFLKTRKERLLERRPDENRLW